jgi:hypothetical protein
MAARYECVLTIWPSRFASFRFYSLSLLIAISAGRSVVKFNKAIVIVQRTVTLSHGEDDLPITCRFHTVHAQRSRHRVTFHTYKHSSYSLLHFFALHNLPSEHSKYLQTLNCTDDKTTLSLLSNIYPAERTQHSLSTTLTTLPRTQNAEHSSHDRCGAGRHTGYTWPYLDRTDAQRQ